MPIHAIKHLKSDDVEFYRKGSFRLTTLKAMQGREDLGDHLHDQWEGKLSAGTEEPVTLFSGDDPVVDSFLKAPPGFPITLSGLSFITEAPNFWIWCVTCSDKAVIQGQGYDAQIEITDLYRLAKRIEIAAGGMLGGPVIKPVQYEARQRQLGRPGLPADPFVKGTEYQHEIETRIVWPMLKPAPDNGTLHVQAPSAVPLLRYQGRRLDA
jgi:hypothetical protein